MTELDVPRWRDADGVVHIVGTHSQSGVWTECGIRMAHRLMVVFVAGAPEIRYEPTIWHTTCFRCLAPDMDTTIRLK